MLGRGWLTSMGIRCFNVVDTLDVSLLVNRLTVRRV